MADCQAWSGKLVLRWNMRFHNLACRAVSASQSAEIARETAHFQECLVVTIQLLSQNKKWLVASD